MNSTIPRRLLLVALSGFTGAASLVAEPDTAGTSSINLHATIAPDTKKPEKPPFFYGAAVAQTLRITGAGAAVTARFDAKVVQGEPEVFSVGLTGAGEISGVSGDNLLDWSVRRDTAGRRFLDLRPKPGMKAGESFVADIVAKLDFDGSRAPYAPVLLLPANAVSSEFSLRLIAAEGIDARPVGVEGLVALQSANPREKNYRARGDAKLTLVSGPSTEAVEALGYAGGNKTKGLRPLL